ncbi:MAG: M56 family metallopeptidase [Planctomycetota bacterium]
MTLAGFGLLALAWLLTYLIHSTLLLGGTWLVVSRRRLEASWQDRLWKLALVGGLITATVQVGAGLEPFGGRVLLIADEQTDLADEAQERSEPQEPQEQREQEAGTTPPPARSEPRFPVDGGGTGSERGAEAARFLLIQDAVEPDVLPAPAHRALRTAQRETRQAPPESLRLDALPTRITERRTQATRASVETGAAPAEPLLRYVAAHPNATVAAAEPERSDVPAHEDAPAPASPQAAATAGLGGPEAQSAGSVASLRTDPEAWRPWLTALWLGGAGLGLLAFAVAFGRLRRHLRGRVELTDGPLRELLDVLVARSESRRRIRLTTSPRLAAPVTLGFFRAEICVPVRALTDLTTAQQEAMLGHELGHALRRDPLWLGICWLLETVLFIQPLNRLGRRRMQHAAELLCDDWAVHLTGRGLSLASCLTEVAQWVVGRPAVLPAPSMAGAPLTLRVERLLDRSPRAVVRRQRWWLPGAASGLVLVALAAPGFAAALTPDAAPRLDLAQERLDAASAPVELPLALDPPTVTEPAPPVDPFAALFDEIDAELALAERDLRGLKRDVVAAGALDEFGDKLRDIEHCVRTFRKQRAHLKDSIQKLLGALGAEADPHASPSPFLSSRSPRSDQR